MTGLKVTSAATGMSVDVDTLSVTKGSAGADGRYAAGRVTAGKVTLVAGPLAINMSNVALDDFAVPAGVGFVFDPMKPFSSVIRAYGIIAKAHIGQAKLGSLALSERLAATTRDRKSTRLNSSHVEISYAVFCLKKKKKKKTTTHKSAQTTDTDDHHHST